MCIPRFWGSFRCVLESLVAPAKETSKLALAERFTSKRCQKNALPSHLNGNVSQSSQLFSSNATHLFSPINSFPLSLRRLDPPLLNISIRGCHMWTSSNGHSFKSSNESLITASYPRRTELLTTDGVNLLPLVLKKPLGDETLPKSGSFLTVKGDCLSRDKGAAVVLLLVLGLFYHTDI